MNHFFRKCILFFLLILVIYPVHAVIVGNYKCTGFDPFLNTKYTGDLTILQTGNTYKFDWIEVNDIYTGTGVYENNIIGVVFSNKGVHKTYGVMSYEFKDDNLLNGKWTYQFQDLIGSENCKKQ